MQQILTQLYESPIGELLIGSLDNQVVLCDWAYRKMRPSIDARIQSFFNAEYVDKSSLIQEEVIHQLKQYFLGNRKQFELNLGFAGSEFQVEVWKQLSEIPFGQTTTYLSLSQQLGKPKAIRAVAAANGANAHAILVPCHRVVDAKGDLVGYAGGLTVKRKLLQLEGQSIQLNLF